MWGSEQGHRNYPKHHSSLSVRALQLISVLYREIQQVFSCFGKVFGTRTWAAMLCLRNAEFLNAERVLLLGGSDPRLFLAQPGSEAACGRRYAVMSVNTRPFNTYLFWGSRSHRPKTEAYVMTVCSPPSLSESCWVGFKEPLASQSSSDGSGKSSHNRSDLKAIHLEQKQL